MKEKMHCHSIVFYDSQCLLCSRLIYLIWKYNKSKNVYFSSLQGGFAQYFLKSFDRFHLKEDTLYFFNCGKLYAKSDAVFHVVKEMSFPFFILHSLLFIPRFIRDAVYDLVASYRKSLPVFSQKCFWSVQMKSRLLQ